MKSRIEVDPEKIKEIPMFFILGRPRSGTTLVRTVFDAHPNISIPLETIVIPELFPEFGRIKEWDKEKIIRFFNKAIKLRYYSNWSSDSEKLKNDLLKLEGKASYSDFIKTFYLNYVSFYDKNQITLIGDKTPYNSNHIPLLIKLFPKAKFIHIIRDPHEHILSMKKVDFGSNSALVISQNWKILNKKIERAKRKNPEKFITVKFEDFLMTPEKFLKEWCEFLSIEYSESMMKFYEIKDQVNEHYTPEQVNKVHSSLLKPIVPGKINAWMDKMSKKDAMICEFVTSRYINSYGYSRMFSKFPLLWKIKIFPKYLNIVFFIHIFNYLKNTSGRKIKTIYYRFF